MNSVPVANYLAVAYIFWVVLGSLSSDAWNTPCLFIFCDKFNFFNQVRLSLRFELYTLASYEFETFILQFKEAQAFASQLLCYNFKIIFSIFWKILPPIHDKAYQSHLE